MRERSEVEIALHNSQLSPSCGGMSGFEFWSSSDTESAELEPVRALVLGFRCEPCDAEVSSTSSSAFGGVQIVVESRARSVPGAEMVMGEQPASRIFSASADPLRSEFGWLGSVASAVCGAILLKASAMRGSEPANDVESKLTGAPKLGSAYQAALDAPGAFMLGISGTVKPKNGLLLVSWLGESCGRAAIAVERAAKSIVEERIMQRKKCVSRR